MKKVICLLLLLLFVAGCSTTSYTIKKLTANPEKYLGKEVTVDGQVNERFVRYGDPFFSLVDKDGFILVQSKFDLVKNQNVTVKGVFSGEKTTGYFIKSSEVRVK